MIDPNNWILKTVESVSVVAGSPSVVTAINEPPVGQLRVYPNPTAETVAVEFTLPAGGPATISVTNLLGQRVRTTTEPTLSPGTHTRAINLRGLSAGRYTLTVETPTGRESRIVLVR